VTMDADSLRERLFEAIAQRDGETFRALCSEHRAVIREQFGAWTMQLGTLTDEAAMQAWAHGLMVTAQYFAATGEPALLNSITGGDDNPLEVWPAAYAEAYQRYQSGDYQGSTDRLLAVLPDLEGARGNMVDKLRPKVYGLLGSSALRAGDCVSALDFTKKALAECRRIDDRQGVWTYTQNLRMVEAVQEALDGDGTPSASARLRSQIAQAQDLSDDLWYAESSALLQEALVALGALPAAVADEYLGKIHGLLGLNAFREGDLEQAEARTGLALETCQRVGDAEGVRIYTFNLDYIRSQRGKNREERVEGKE
jgi:tetratricopeptide (TPR) repeat protein